ncbi:MAG: efflux RND transporter permease subunit [Desulfotignum sp.]|nr:efflux RND transporter permease subunit [Desulfotignum sp.]
MAIVNALRIAVAGDASATVHMSGERQPLFIRLILPRNSRSSKTSLTQIPMATPDGSMVPLAELVTFQNTPNAQTIYHKNLDRVVYALAEVAGRVPAEAIFGLRAKAG